MDDDVRVDGSDQFFSGAAVFELQLVSRNGVAPVLDKVWVGAKGAVQRVLRITTQICQEVLPEVPRGARDEDDAPPPSLQQASHAIYGNDDGRCLGQPPSRHRVCSAP